MVTCQCRVWSNGFPQTKVNRTADIIFSLFTLLFLFVPFTFIILLVVFFIDPNPIFVQERIGKSEKKFKLIKLKTMKEVYDSSGNLLPDEKRLTKLGQLLRSSSLDELPSVLNILKGDMSFIGPRPLLPEYLPFYSDEEKKRHQVRPGLTGLAQVEGRNALTWEEKFYFDNLYVQNRSFFLNLKILFLTIKIVITRSGISPHNETIMPRLDVLRKK